MTGICAFTSENRDAAMSSVKTMLDAMRVRGRVAETASGETEEGEVVIGSCWFPRSPPRGPQWSESSAHVLDGGFFPQTPVTSLDLFGMESIGALIRAPGAFALLAFDGTGPVASRDCLGQKPLYWGTDKHGNYAFASLRLALASVGILDPKPVVPGQIVKVSRQGPTMAMDSVLTKPQHREVSEAEALEQIETLLLEAVHNMVPEKSALAFSGGLDSALVATACKKADLKPELITVGLQGQPELEHAAQAAGSIGFHMSIKRLSAPQVVEALPDVVRTTESESPVTVGISVPFYFACQQAAEMGFDTIVAGQLSDELYGGYARFENLAVKEGLDKVDLAMWGSVLAAAEGDFEPGDKVAASFGLELRCPFAYLPLVNSTLQLPVCLRVRVSENGVTRKYILRRLAEKWGLPPNIVNRPKKAFQYSSGVQKVLVREARRRGQKLGELLALELNTLLEP